MRYEDFTIRITSGSGDRYRILVNSPMGSGEADLDLPFRLSDLEGVLSGVAATVRGTTMRDLEVPAEGAETTRTQETGTFGVELYRALFRDTVQSMLDQCLGSVRNLPDTGLRIRLEMDLRSGRMSDVASLPWELMRREIHDVPLSVSKRTTVVRAFDVMRPAEPIAFEPPLRVLVIVSNPGGTAQLNLAEEEKRIRATWGRLEDVDVQFVAPTVDAMLDICAARDFHVIHYMGHGDFDPVTGQGILYLEKPDGSPDPLGADRLKALFQDEADTLRLVFLNACKTAVSSERKGLDPFAGIATMLIDAGVPAVVAMQFPISDDAAITFSDTFYRRIVAGFPVDAAVAEGRKALWVEGNPRMEWATPVLFMRSKDGVIFTRREVTVEPIPDARAVPSFAATTAPPPPPVVDRTPMPALSGGAGAAPPSRKMWWLAGGGIAALGAAGIIVSQLGGPPAPSVPLVTEIGFRTLPETVYVAASDVATLRIFADGGQVYEDGAIPFELAGAVTVHARSEPEDVLSAVYDDEAGVIQLSGLAAGMASVWAVALLPDGDSVFTNPEPVPVAVGSDDILAAMRAHNAARVVLEGTAADDEALAAFEQTLADHADALASGGDEAAVNATIESLRGLIAVRETADSSALRDDLTLAEKIAADAAYLARRTAVRGTGGEDYTRIAARRDSLTRVASSGDSLTKLFVCARLSGEHCAESELASPLPAGSTAHLTVWYVGTRPFTVRWFREGEEVASRTRNANQRVATGYRVTFQHDVGQAGEWEARIYNSSDSFIGRKAFTVR